MKKLPSDFVLNKYGIDARFVDEDDTDFVLSLRANKELTKYIHQVDDNRDKQLKWIRKYKIRESEGLEYYFIFSRDGIDYGLERIYDIKEDSFTHGSFLFRPESPIGMSSLCDIITREVGFDILGIPKNLFDVRKGNNNVLHYHKTFQPTFLYETELDRFYELSKENFDKNKQRYLRIFNKK
jgi:hypothetical protein